MVEKSNLKLIVEYFFDGKITGHSAEVKALSEEDKQQLSEAIRNGTLTY